MEEHIQTGKMKKILLTLTIVALATATFAQIDSVVFNPNFGIELGSYNETSIVFGDTVTIKHTVKFMYPEYQEDGVRFHYMIYDFVNDTIPVRSDRMRLPVPLQAEISGKTVFEWLNMTYAQRTGNPSDTTILTTLSKEVFMRKVLQK
jgi:hypothetical protein